MIQRLLFQRFFAAVAICILIPCSMSCGGSRPSHLFSLTPEKGTTGDFRADPPMTRVAIGIRTLKLPDYMLREQIVTRTESDEIVVSEYHRWAEPVEKNFERVLLEDLSKNIPTNNIFLFPAKDTSVTNYQIVMEVIQFERQNNNTVILSVRWSIAEGEQIAFLMDKHSSYSEQISNEKYDSIVSAMSRLVGKLSEEIAAEIRNRAHSAK